MIARETLLSSQGKQRRCSARGYLVKPGLRAQRWALGKHLRVCWAGGRCETLESPSCTHLQLWALPPPAWPLRCKCQGFGAVIIRACKFAPGIYCKHAAERDF